MVDSLPGAFTSDATDVARRIVDLFGTLNNPDAPAVDRRMAAARLGDADYEKIQLAYLALKMPLHLHTLEARQFLTRTMRR